MCDFIAVKTTNLDGPGDNFDLKNSHVLPALIRKFHEAKTSGSKSVEIRGTGRSFREFLHMDDLGGCLRLFDEQLLRRIVCEYRRRQGDNHSFPRGDDKRDCKV